MTRPFDDAMARARGHLRASTIESLEAARALIEAARHAADASPPAPDSLAGDLDAALDAWIEALRSGRRLSLPPRLALPLLRALEREIERWQARSHRDGDARVVLRAFLGLRELLWELGVRGATATGRAAPPDRGARAKRAAGAPPKSATEVREAPSAAERVQRFDVEG